MQVNIIQVILIILIRPVSLMQENCNDIIVSLESAHLLSTTELSGQFASLRTGDKSCNSRWGSDMHLIMQELGIRLGEKGVSGQEIIKLMGTPDFQSQSFDMVKLGEDESIIIYHWRGWHDWLYFIIKDDLVEKYDWWFAFE